MRLGIVIAFGLFLASYSGQAQYNLPNDPYAKKDSTQQDSAKSQEDTQLQTNTPPAVSGNSDAKSNVRNARKFADTWLRRLLFRGWLDTSHIGAFAEYQLTDWSEVGGSEGPVDARITIQYLGSTYWLGKDAEWLQATVKVIDTDETIIDYDLIVPATQKITELNRVLYRIDRGDIQTGNFTLPETEVDYDKIDQPRVIDEKEIRLFAGTFESEVYAGSGTNGAIVYSYRTKSLPPLGIVILGYGDKGLTLRNTGSNATPRMNIPPPPER
jgi:hypothetical protein